jgi:hypothetical protein
MSQGYPGAMKVYLPATERGNVRRGRNEEDTISDPLSLAGSGQACLLGGTLGQPETSV